MFTSYPPSAEQEPVPTAEAPSTSQEHPPSDVCPPASILFRDRVTDLEEELGEMESDHHVGRKDDPQERLKVFEQKLQAIAQEASSIEHLPNDMDLYGTLSNLRCRKIVVGIQMNVEWAITMVGAFLHYAEGPNGGQWLRVNEQPSSVRGYWYQRTAGIGATFHPHGQKKLHEAEKAYERAAIMTQGLDTESEVTQKLRAVVSQLRTDLCRVDILPKSIRR